MGHARGETGTGGGVRGHADYENPRVPTGWHNYPVETPSATSFYPPEQRSDHALRRCKHERESF